MDHKHDWLIVADWGASDCSWCQICGAVISGGNGNTAPATSYEVHLPKSGHLTRRFFLQRDRDVSGVSGTGIVADGIQFNGGPCLMKWRGRLSGMEILPDMDTLIAIHGHEGATYIVWVDEEES
jgi:hypothetical protein